MKTIRLSGKIGSGKNALVDDENFFELSKIKWGGNKGKAGNIYAVSPEYYRKNGKIISRSILMHRLILKAEKGMQVDHINGNGLDNRKKNLRLVSNRQNCWNQKKGKGVTSKYKGVCTHNPSGLWRSYIFFKKQITLGYFKDEEKAARAYDEGAKKYFGEFARLNFPEVTA